MVPWAPRINTSYLISSGSSVNAGLTVTSTFVNWPLFDIPNLFSSYYLFPSDSIWHDHFALWQYTLYSLLLRYGNRDNVDIRWLLLAGRLGAELSRNVLNSRGHACYIMHRTVYEIEKTRVKLTLIDLQWDTDTQLTTAVFHFIDLSTRPSQCTL